MSAVRPIRCSQYVCVVVVVIGGVVLVGQACKAGKRQKTLLCKIIPRVKEGKI